MSLLPEDTAGMKDLCEAYAAGLLSDKQWLELERRLQADEAARLVFLTYLEVHAGLAWESRQSGLAAPLTTGQSHVENAPTPIIEPGQALKRGRGLVWGALLGSAIVICLLVAVGLHLAEKPGAPTSPQLATVKAGVHASRSNGEDVVEGTPVHAGVFDLQSGLVELETTTGVVLILEGPAQMDLQDALHASLLRGNLVVRMRKGESGFVVSTPQMKVTDLGTEFGVSATPDGVSKVQVYEGKVRAEAGNASPGRELVAGEMLSRQTGGELTPGTFRENQFVRQFPPRRPGEIEGGALYNHSTRDSVSVVPPLGPVRIDGDLGEWNAAGAFRSACEPPYAQTYFLEGRMMYDATHLYLAAHVGDPEPMRNAVSDRSGMEFAGGSVIVRVSTDRKLGWPLRGTSGEVATAVRKGKVPPADAMSDRIANLILWHDATTGKPRLKVAYGLDSHGTSVNPAGWEGRFRKDEDGRGYTLEYAIPWTLLNCQNDAPRAGDVLAALWMVHWSDADGRLCRGQLVDVTNQQPHEFPKVSPGAFFQYGPTWGRALYLPAASR